VTLPITVAVCTKNAESYIERCLEAVIANQPAQIIVVDACSGDKTWHIIKDWPGIFPVAKYGVGLASQRQIALSYTNQPYYAAVDCFHILYQRCLLDLMREMDWYGFQAIQAREWQVPSENWWTNARASANYDITTMPHVEETNMVGRPALYRTKALRAIGGFDSKFDFVGDEDTDVSIRMEMAGYRMGHGTGIAKRLDELDYHSAMRKFVKYGRGDARIVRKYPRKRLAIIRHQLWTYPWRRGLKHLEYWPYYALCGWVRFGAMMKELTRGE